MINPRPPKSVVVALFLHCSLCQWSSRALVQNWTGLCASPRGLLMRLRAGRWVRGRVLMACTIGTSLRMMAHPLPV